VCVRTYISLRTRSTLQLLAQDTGGRGDGAGRCAGGCAACLSGIEWDSVGFSGNAQEKNESQYPGICTAQSHD